jgi:protein-L-isoaspartate O-methyltransferase
MSWRCSADTNAQLVSNLEAAGIITSASVRDAMLQTDRGHFAPAVGAQRKRSSTYNYGQYADAPQVSKSQVIIFAFNVRLAFAHVR